MNIEAAQRMLSLVRVTNELMSRLQTKQAREQEVQAQLQQRIPQVVEALADNERILPQEKEAAAKALTDPLEALRLLENLAKHRTEKEASLGEPYGGATTGKSRPLGGAVLDWDETEAGRRFRETFLGV